MYQALMFESLFTRHVQVMYRDGPKACEFQWHRKVSRKSDLLQPLDARAVWQPHRPLLFCREAAPTNPCPTPTQRLFDHPVAAMLHELCAAAPLATVTSVDGARKSKWAPVPLSTLEMQKRGSQVGGWCVGVGGAG